MLPLPAELWHKIFACYEQDSPTLALVCLVCKDFNSLAQPLVFRKVTLYNLLAYGSGEVALCGRNGILLGSYVNEMEVEVVMEVEAMDRSDTWHPMETQMARKKAEVQCKKAFAILDVCTEIKALTWRLECHRFYNPEKPHYLYPEDFYGTLPTLSATDLLSLPCLDKLRSLNIVFTNGPRVYNAQAFGEVIVAATQLETVRLEGVDEPTLFEPLLARFASDPAFTHALATLSVDTDLGISETSWMWQATAELSILTNVVIVAEQVLDFTDFPEDMPWPVSNLVTHLSLSVTRDFTWEEDLKEVARLFPCLQTFTLDGPHSTIRSESQAEFVRTSLFPTPHDNISIFTLKLAIDEPDFSRLCDDLTILWHLHDAKTLPALRSYRLVVSSAQDLSCWVINNFRLVADECASDAPEFIHLYIALRTSTTQDALVEVEKSASGR